jgi:hypothetical protein
MQTPSLPRRAVANLFAIAALLLGARGAEAGQPTAAVTIQVNPAATAGYSSLAGTTPAGGSNPYYPSSPFHSTLPGSPVLASSSQITQWNGDQSPDDWGGITISEDASNGNDGSDPTYYTNGDGTSTTLICALNSAGSVGKYYCDNSLSNYRNSIVDFWNNAGNCPDSNYGGTNYGCPVGVSFGIPPNMLTAGDTDHHGIVVKTTEAVNGHTGFEVDGWGDGTLSSRTRPTSGSWTWAALGVCDLSGDGTACSNSYAANIAGSLGLIRAEDILYCLDGAGSANPNCTLPTALRVAPKCNGSPYTYPASASDGQCGGNGTSGSTSSNRVPEGERGFINETDAQVNAENIPDYAKVIRRTQDKQHYGFFDGDTNYSGGPGIVYQYQGGEAYASMGHTDPWKTLYTYEVAEGNGSSIATGNSGKDMTFAMGQSASNVEWCSNSHTNGLCN